MENFQTLLNKFDYHVPPEQIAQSPASPRDSAKLLIYDRKSKQIEIDTFKNLPNYIPKNAVIVFNQTKVAPARLRVTKKTGGKADLLFISKEGSNFTFLSNKKLGEGTEVELTKTKRFLVLSKNFGKYTLKPLFKTAGLQKMLDQYGTMPLPPYINKSPLTEKQIKQQYQTVFAKTGLSVAAPTASLHFTKPLIAKLQKQGNTVVYINLNVGLGTFAPLKPEFVEKGELHFEEYEISKKAADVLNKAKKQGRPIFAVGTTVVRTLESATKKGKLQKLSGSTNLFIREHSKIHFVTGLVTNFHVPQSSLLMLVSAFVGREKLLELYKVTIAKKFRFFSFGDGMLVK